MNPIIFLDIDGVLNTTNYNSLNHFYRRHEAEIKGLQFSSPDLRCRTRDKYGHLFDITAVRYLSLLISQTDADIVISSTWKLSGLSVMREMWKYRSLPGNVIDITPTLPNEPRGKEIAKWCEDNNFTGNYVILDDDSDMLPEQISNFAQCSTNYGLDYLVYGKALSILTR